ncbi:MAG: hypothetical protein JWQ21_3654 [Herminiimonas sp.]|nr:hypothetical protein [Herminiimonas sp.]
MRRSRCRRTVAGRLAALRESGVLSERFFLLFRAVRHVPMYGTSVYIEKYGHNLACRSDSVNKKVRIKSFDAAWPRAMAALPIPVRFFGANAQRGRPGQAAAFYSCMRNNGPYLTENLLPISSPATIIALLRARPIPYHGRSDPDCRAMVLDEYRHSKRLRKIAPGRVRSRVET